MEKRLKEDLVNLLLDNNFSSEDISSIMSKIDLKKEDDESTKYVMCSLDPSSKIDENVELSHGKTVTSSIKYGWHAISLFNKLKEMPLKTLTSRTRIAKFMIEKLSIEESSLLYLNEKLNENIHEFFYSSISAVKTWNQEKLNSIKKFNFEYELELPEKLKKELTSIKDIVYIATKGEEEERLGLIIYDNNGFEIDEVIVNNIKKFLLKTFSYLETSCEEDLSSICVMYYDNTLKIIGNKTSNMEYLGLRSYILFLLSTKKGYNVLNNKDLITESCLERFENDQEEGSIEQKLFKLLMKEPTVKKTREEKLELLTARFKKSEETILSEITFKTFHTTFNLNPIINIKNTLHV